MTQLNQMTNTTFESKDSTPGLDVDDTTSEFDLVSTQGDNESNDTDEEEEDEEEHNDKIRRDLKSLQETLNDALDREEAGKAVSLSFPLSCS